jgi:flagellar hook-associated protein 1 FlgK
MSGLLGTLNLGSRALQTQSQGLALAGQNLANVHNPAYTRQRLVIQTESGTGEGLDTGGGVTTVAIQRIHDSIVERQILGETSTSGSWSARQDALRSAQSSLGEVLDGSGTLATGKTGSSLSTELDGLFNEFQNLAASPASIPQRSVLISQAESIAAKLNQADARLDGLEADLNESVVDGIEDANALVASIAQLSGRIFRQESSGAGSANELRDLREQKLQTLAGLTSLEAVEDDTGALNVSIGGRLMVSGGTVIETLAAVDLGGGRQGVATSAGDGLTLTGGSIHGTMEARDGALASLRTGLDSLAGALASGINGIHRTGFDLNGQTGADFFEGTTAGTLQVNPMLVSDPSRIQAAGQAGASGDNTIARAMASLAKEPVAALGGQTFAGSYARTVAGLGQALATANTEVEDQAILHNALQARRASVSGVSIDEEMADIVKYQKAFQASARVVSIVDSMLSEIINLIR